jgi:hypothetical protein
MADLACPAGFDRHVDLDANLEWCENAQGQRAPVVVAQTPTNALFGKAGLLAALVILCALLVAPARRRRR